MPGQARLALTAREAAAYRCGASLAKDRPPSVGDRRLRLFAERRKLSG